MYFGYDECFIKKNAFLFVALLHCLDKCVIFYVVNLKTECVFLIN